MSKEKLKEEKLLENQLEKEIISTSESTKNITEDEIEDVEEDEPKPCCCANFCYYLFCCCCCGCCQCCCCAKKKLSNNFYIKKWRKYLNSHHVSNKNDAFTPLTKFFVKSEDAMNELKKVRLNPDLDKIKGKIRNDLEFYIPQLCNFILFGDVEDIEEFFAFLCRAANLNFFFAQRVHWFLSAMINSDEEKKDNIISILKMINTIFKSENNDEENILINFYISMSDGYVSFINNNNLGFLYRKQINTYENVFDIIDINNLNEKQLNIISKYKNSREKICNYSTNELDNMKDELKNLETKSVFKKDKFEPDDFFIDISNFKLVHEDFTYEIDDIIEVDNEYQEIKGIKEDLNFVSYHSSINFIEHLCDISNELSKQPIENQMVFLFEKITEINKKLPCNVYLPFLHDSCRNYFICHIPLEGAKIFRTKTRCPIMLTFELIRISDVICKINGKKKNNIEEEDKLLSKPIFAIGNKDNILKIRSKKDLNNLNNLQANDNENNNKIRQIIKNYKVNHINNRSSFIHKSSFELNFDNPLEKKSTDDINKTVLIENEEKKKEDNVLLNTIPDINVLANSNNEINTKSINPNKNQIQNINDNINIDIKKIKNVFGTTFKEKSIKIKENSLFGNIQSHKIFRCIIKTNEDLRQEQFATQLINEFYQIFKQEKVNCWLNTYEIISTGNNSGLVEMINDSLSLDQLKQETNNISLKLFFEIFFDKKSKPDKYKKAMNNYISSLAGYSLVCYFLQIKDRHNGNILLDRNGHLIHIDFGFLLSNSPGKGLKFETAPFKLTKDMVDVLEGENSEYFNKLKKYLKDGFKAIIKHKEKILILVEMMWCGHGKNLPCYEREQDTINELRERLEPKEDDIVDTLISQSIGSWSTTVYDYFQYYVQGINC